MADRVSATIAISGLFPQSQLSEICRIVENEGLNLDWECDVFSPDAIPVDGPVELMAHEVAWGYFEGLEQFCCDQGLAFVRWSGGCAGSFGPERYVFTGVGEPVSHAVTKDNELVFDLETIRTLATIDAIEACAIEAGFRPGPLVIAAIDAADDRSMMVTS